MLRFILPLTLSHVLHVTTRLLWLLLLLLFCAHGALTAVSAGGAERALAGAGAAVAVGNAAGLQAVVRHDNGVATSHLK